jgi:hypothetical protein
MGGKGSKGLDKEVTKLHNGIGRSKNKSKQFQNKGKGPLKDVNMVENFNKIEKVSDLDVEEKEFVEEDKSSSKLLVGK